MFIYILLCCACGLACAACARGRMYVRAAATYATTVYTSVGVVCVCATHLCYAFSYTRSHAGRALGAGAWRAVSRCAR